MYYLKYTPVDDLISLILTPSGVSINFRPSQHQHQIHTLHILVTMTKYPHDLLYQFCN